MGARRWWILVALMVGLLPVVLDVGFVLAAVRTMPGGALAAAALPAGAVASLPLANRLDRVRPGLLLGLAGCVCLAVCEPATSRPTQLALLRVLGGVAAALALSSAFRALGQVFEPAEQLRALSIWAGFTGLALALSPLLGGLLVDAHGWAAVFAVEVPFFAVGFAALAYLLPRLSAPRASSSRHFAPAAAAATLLLVVACVAVERRATGSRAAVGGLLLVGFTGFSVAARAVSSALRRWRPPLVLAAGTALLVLSGVLLAVTAAAAWILPLSVAAAVVLGLVPSAGPTRLAAVAAGFAVGALDPQTAVLLASAGCVGAGLLGGLRGGGGDLPPP
jgi:DHA2 family methylenomycin A resistance protein-like MFS transporter